MAFSCRTRLRAFCAPLHVDGRSLRVVDEGAVCRVDADEGPDGRLRWLAAERSGGARRRVSFGAIKENALRDTLWH